MRSFAFFWKSHCKELAPTLPCLPESSMFAPSVEKVEGILVSRMYMGDWARAK